MHTFLSYNNIRDIKFDDMHFIINDYYALFLSIKLAINLFNITIQVQLNLIKISFSQKFHILGFICLR